MAKRDLKLSRVLKRLSGYQVLILDDLGYVQQSREEMEVLFTLLAERYERGSVRWTSNLPFSGWEAILKDAMTTTAAIDRLVHHLARRITPKSFWASIAHNTNFPRAVHGRLLAVAVLPAIPRRTRHSIFCPSVVYGNSCKF